MTFSWDHVTIVYSDDLYGRESLAALERELSSQYICSESSLSVRLGDVSAITSITTNGVVYVGTSGAGAWQCSQILDSFHFLSLNRESMTRRMIPYSSSVYSEININHRNF